MHNRPGLMSFAVNLLLAVAVLALGTPATYAQTQWVPPPNDLISGALDLVLPTTYTQLIVEAAVSSDDPVNCSVPANTVWFRYTHDAEAAGLQINTQSNDDEDEAVLSMYTGSPGSLTLLICRYGYAPSIHFSAQPGAVYYFMWSRNTWTNLPAPDTTLSVQLSALPPPPPPPPNLLVNGTFDDQLTGWGAYATNAAGQVDMSRIVYQVSAGVLEFYRRPNSASAAMVQYTNAPVGSDQPLQLSFQAGNSSAARKRIVIVIHDADWSDLMVCAFFLDPNTPLKAYSMSARTSEAWSGASVDFYSSPGNDLGWFRLDNVSMSVAGYMESGDTQCIDPNVDGATAVFGTANYNFINNSDFSQGNLNWGTFATPNTADVVTDLSGGVMQFYRRQGSTSGVVTQNTGSSINGYLSRKTFQLMWRMGNSSPLRKRVIVIVHDFDWSDSLVCSFWLDAGQPLTHYLMRTSPSEDWSALNVSFYDNPTPGNPSDANRQWTRIDDVRLIFPHWAYANGTYCGEDEDGLPETGGLTALTPNAGGVIEGVDPSLRVPLDGKPLEIAPLFGGESLLPTLIPLHESVAREGEGATPVFDGFPAEQVPTLIPTATPTN